MNSRQHEEAWTPWDGLQSNSVAEIPFMTSVENNVLNARTTHEQELDLWRFRWTADSSTRTDESLRSLLTRASPRRVCWSRAWPSSDRRLLDYCEVALRSCGHRFGRKSGSFQWQRRSVIRRFRCWIWRSNSDERISNRLSSAIKPIWYEEQGPRHKHGRDKEYSICFL